MIFLVLLQLYFHSGTRSQKVNNKLSINLLTPSIIEPTASRPMPNHPTRLTDKKFSISLLTPSRISLDEEILPREAIWWTIIILRSSNIQDDKVSPTKAFQWHLLPKKLFGPYQRYNPKICNKLSTKSRYHLPRHISSNLAPIA